MATATARAHPGVLLQPGEAGYEALESGFNIAIEHRPAVIVEATGPADVVAAVKLAAGAGRPVAVMNTGTGRRCRPMARYWSAPVT